MNRAISRRTFIGGAAGIAGVAAGTAIGLTRGTTSKHPATAAPRPGAGILVVVALYGGNDGLNTVIPYQDGAYLSARTSLGYQPSEILPLDQHLALHPNLKGLKGLWDARQLAIVLGVGYPNPNRSHFRSMDIWQSGVPDTNEITGWLGRWLDQGGDDPMRALSLGPTLPRLLSGAKTSAGSLPSGQLQLPGLGRYDATFAALNATHSSDSGWAARVAQSGTDLLTLIGDVGQILANQPPAAVGGGSLEPSPTPSTGSLAGQLDLVARLIKGGAPTQVYGVSLGGFDTHAAEKDNHARLMTELDGALSGFLKGLEGDRRANEVVVMTFSEFGRRVAANASGGTDHGTAAPLFVAGPGVRGGLYGEQPSLTDLDQGDLKFTTDFRSVYATVLAHVIGTDPKPVLGGQTFPILPFV